MVFVKICGITRREDADLAATLGANAVGFVFWPKSPRFIDPARARAIVSELPPFVSAVGLFVNQTVAEINATAEQVGLHVVQLHGDESPAIAQAIGRPILKAVAAHQLDTADDWSARVTLLVDAHDPVRRGGTGRVADWEAAAALAARRRVLLAGGLTPLNVIDAISQVRPYGVDVSSGVEVSPGVKDRERMIALFKALHDVHYQPARS